MIVTLEDLAHLEKAFDEFLAIENTLSDDFKATFLLGVTHTLENVSEELMGTTPVLKIAWRLLEYTDKIESVK